MSKASKIDIKIIKDCLKFEDNIQKLLEDIHNDINDVHPEYVSFLFFQLLTFKKLCLIKFKTKLNIKIHKKLIKGVIDESLIKQSLLSIQKITKKG